MHPPYMLLGRWHCNSRHKVEGQRRSETAAQSGIGKQAIGRSVSRHQQIEAELPHPIQELA